MNSMLHIIPYKSEGQWVFDDFSKGLDKEPFVFGIDTMLDQLTEHMPDRDSGVSLLFSGEAFPSYDIRLDHIREEQGGNWYHCVSLGMDGWLCPALFRYFEKAPKNIYVKIDPKKSS